MIRIGILGFAHGHIHQIAGQWREHPEYGVECVYGWDHDRERAEKGCADHGLTRCETAEELLNKDISAVIITSETDLHAPLVEMAAAAGKDIILYKPMALNMAEADRIVNAVERAGVRFTMAWQMRVDPQNIKMRDLIRSGELGRPVLYRRRHCLATHTWPWFADSWHAQRERNRDIFADDSSHPVNMMQWMFGMPETVTCEMSTMVDPRIPNDNGVALFRYPDGLICEISCSFTCSASEITTEIYLDKGSIQQYNGDAPATRLPQTIPGLKWYREGDADWTVSDIPSPPAHSLRLGWQAKPLAEFLQGGEPVCTAREGRDTLRLVLACYVSAKEGRRVYVYDPAVTAIE